MSEHWVPDERCGTYAGAVAHWFNGERPCDDCARAEWRYRKRRKLDRLNGRPRTISAIGVRRRVEALLALGWSGPQIAEASGVSVHTLYSIRYHDVAAVRTTTAEKVDAAFDALGGTWPEGGYAHRGRLHAQRRGWVPPAAWLDIDDPDEQPDPGYRQKHYRAAELVEEYEWLRHHGETKETAAARLGVSVDAIEKAVKRAADQEVA